MREAFDGLEYDKILALKDSLLDLNSRNLVKINHSVMELVTAKYLIENGFDVKLEHELDGVFCDVYAMKGYGSVIVEVETGFVPPENAVDPATYLKARIASKITRYSGFANKFILATPPYYIMQIPPALTKPPRFRTDEEIASIKGLCDLYYTSPPVSLEEVRNARLHSIYAVDVDNVSVREWEVNEYLGKAALWTV
ncbi:MAG: hypothetical protein NWE75_04125 [Candidatus Bathyarchaeota archaeon]|nr:hypothetical protein [Candidatus Bathyarchaeota archaeon]